MSTHTRSVISGFWYRLFTFLDAYLNTWSTYNIFIYPILDIISILLTYIKNHSLLFFFRLSWFVINDIHLFWNDNMKLKYYTKIFRWYEKLINFLLKPWNMKAKKGTLTSISIWLTNERIILTIMSLKNDDRTRFGNDKWIMNHFHRHLWTNFAISCKKCLFIDSLINTQHYSMHEKIYK